MVLCDNNQYTNLILYDYTALPYSKQGYEVLIGTRFQTRLVYISKDYTQRMCCYRKLISNCLRHRDTKLILFHFLTVVAIVMFFFLRDPMAVYQ